ncbi:MAG: FHA domain-containing protein [Deltaproteobacteria bacterium]|nr:FHA domain-containing protein [Deltaproteobacteria bacterium]
MRFRLRYLKHDLELSSGTFAIGRSADCQLSLDDPLVSRRHALLHVRDNEVLVEDAGSRNGVLVNGLRIDQRTRLGDGDVITIGAQEMTISVIADSEHGRRTVRASPATSAGPVTLVTMPAAQPIAAQNSPEIILGDESTIARPKRGEALKLLGGVADKALALGNPESAERLLQNGLQELISDVRAGRPVPSESLDVAARFAARLASGTGKGAWGDYAIELYAQTRALPPSPIVDELYVAARKMKGFDLARFRAYLDQCRGRIAELSPTEKFVLQRLEGLERIIATR